MPPNGSVSLFRNVRNLNIGGGTFIIQNTPVTTVYNVVRQRPAGEDLDVLRSVLHSVIHQGDITGRESRSSIEINIGHALLSKGWQLLRVLPIAHHELAQQLAGWIRPGTAIRGVNLKDNAVLVGAPLATASIFRTLPEGAQVMVLYLLVAMLLVDLLHPLRLDHKRPSSQVTVIDALGKYHDFPWAACENMTTFHREFLKRFCNQTGFSFVKRRKYEVEYNGCILKSEGWAVVKPFTSLFVDFIHIQQDPHKVIKCPWCQWTNPIPLASSLEQPTDKGSCSQCERDFFVTTMTESLQTPIDGSVTVDGSSTKGGSDPIISTEIRRLRIKFRLGEPPVSATYSEEVTIVITPAATGGDASRPSISDSLAAPRPKGHRVCRSEEIRPIPAFAITANDSFQALRGQSNSTSTTGPLIFPPTSHTDFVQRQQQQNQVLHPNYLPLATSASHLPPSSTGKRRTSTYPTPTANPRVNFTELKDPNDLSFGNQSHGISLATVSDSPAAPTPKIRCPSASKETRPLPAFATPVGFQEAHHSQSNSMSTSGPFIFPLSSHSHFIQRQQNQFLHPNYLPPATSASHLPPSSIGIRGMGPYPTPTANPRVDFTEQVADLDASLNGPSLVNQSLGASLGSTGGLGLSVGMSSVGAGYSEAVAITGRNTCNQAGRGGTSSHPAESSGGELAKQNITTETANTSIPHRKQGAALNRHLGSGLVRSVRGLLRRRRKEEEEMRVC